MTPSEMNSFVISETSRAEREKMRLGDTSVAEWLVSRLIIGITPSQSERIVFDLMDHFSIEKTAN